MDSGITTIVAAAVAVLGTLSAAVLTQRSSARAKVQEFELARQRRQDEREFETQQRDFADRRVAYTRLNTEMRKLRRALNNYLHLIRAGTVTEKALESLNDVRDRYSESYAEAQMIISDKIFAPARKVNRGLLDVYGIVRKLDGFRIDSLTEETRADGGETADSAHALLGRVMQDLNSLRKIMRDDLGVPKD